LFAQQCVRTEQIRYATSRDGGRTWVVDEVTLPEGGTYLEADIHRGRICIADQGVRFKDTGGVRFLNRNPSKGSAPEEGDVAISDEIFEFLWDAAEGKRIEKIRYEVPCDPDLNGGGLTWQVDQYLGPLESVVIAEVVLKNGDIIAILPEKIAEVAIRNVTGDSQFRYEALATLNIAEL
jgi:CYTH domain-containing protein